MRDKHMQFMPRQGKLISWSKVHAGPTGYESYVPYFVAIIELTNGQRITSQLCDVNANELRYGLPLQATFRKVVSDGNSGIISYGYKFKPLIAPKE